MHDEGEDAPDVLRHEGHEHAPTPATSARDAGAARADAGSAGKPPANCPDTFDAIQTAIFDSKTYNCANVACHGSEGGHIDLRKGFSYDSLLGLGDDHAHAHEEGVHAHDHAATLEGFDVLHHEDAYAHVIPGRPEESVLYDNLRARVENVPTKLGGTPMPLGGRALSKDELRAVELWIVAGAPRTGFVAGTEAVCPKPTPNPGRR